MCPPKEANRWPMSAMPAMPVILFGGDPSKTSLEEYSRRSRRSSRPDLPSFWIPFLSSSVELCSEKLKNDLPNWPPNPSQFQTL